MKGLTLIELLVTLAVFALLVAIGLPQMQGFSTSNRLSSFVNSLSGDINFARSEAVNRNSPISISAVGGNWANGWIVTDDNAAGGPLTIRNAGPVPGGFTIVETNTAATALTYTGQGLKTNNAILNFQVCEPSSNMRLLEISPVGRVSYNTGGACP